MKTVQDVQTQINKHASVASGVAQACFGLVDEKARLHLISANHLTRNVAYRLNDLADEDILDGPSFTIHVIDEDGVVREYTPKKISVDHKGLVVFILKAVPAQDEKDINPRVHLVFRGTKDLAAWERNLTNVAPGRDAIYGEHDVCGNKESILNELMLAITSPQTHLIVSGHSLGGADAENFLTIIMNQVSQCHGVESDSSQDGFEQSMPSLLNISEITLNAANPAGVLELDAYSAKRDAEYLSSKGIRINVMYISAAGDPVPQSGEAHILANCKADNIKIYLARFNHDPTKDYVSGKNMGILGAGAMFAGFTTAGSLLILAGVGLAFGAHKSKITVEQLLDGSFELFSNDTKSGEQRIICVLGKHCFDSVLISGARTMLNSWYKVPNGRDSSSSSEEDSRPSTPCTSSPEDDSWVHVPKPKPKPEPEPKPKSKVLPRKLKGE